MAELKLDNRNVTLVGVGRTAVACAELLLREGANVFATDAGNGPSVSTARDALEALGVATEVGGHTSRALEDSALIVVSPGVPPAIGLLQDARKCGIPIVGEMELASQYCEAPIVAVTGTNGKTTVTEWTHHCLKSAGVNSAIAGNNAVPLSRAVMAHESPEIYVVEVSSYALESVETFRPRAGAVLNLTPDHLARHGTMEAYAAAKARMFGCMSPDDTAILNADDDVVWAMGATLDATVMGFSMKKPVDGGVWIEDGVIRDEGGAIIAIDALSIPGRHNVANALAVVALLKASGFGGEAALEGLKDFPGVEHRLEQVCATDGITYYNDSKSTNIDSLAVALKAFDKPIVLIAGGEGKGADYSVLVELVAHRVKFLVTLGADAELMEAAWGAHVAHGRAEDMAGAVAMATDAAAAGDVVLLSPGCASFDMYSDFEARGRHFKEIVTGLRAGVDA